MHIKPSPALLSEKLTTPPFCCFQTTDRNENKKLRSVQRWSDQSDSTLQDRFGHVDWDMFRIASNNNDEYADSVSEFIRKCIDVVPIATIKKIPKPETGFMAAFV